MGAQELTPGVNYETMTMDLGSKNDISGFNLGVRYEYGLNEMISLGGKLSYASYTNKPETGDSTSISGLEDIELDVKGMYGLTAGTLRYGATLAFSMGENKTNSDGDVSANSGGNTLTPYVGYEYASGPSMFGAKLSFDLLLGKRKLKDESTTPATSSDQEGGTNTSIDLFYEHTLSAEMLLGAALDYTMVSDDKVAGVSSENVTPVLDLKVYLPIEMGGGTLIPSIHYGMTTDSEVGGTDIDAFSAMGLGVDYRMAL